jgi:putative transferase (TIGR04331 family)
MVKSNFIISVYRKIWLAGAKRLFLAEPFVYHDLEKSSQLKYYEEVEVGPNLRQTREEIINDDNFVYQKYQKYIPLLASRLNQIHNVNYDVFFWQKSLSLSLVRHITYMFDMFKMCRKSFDPNLHDCQILSEKSYFVPRDFNEHRDFIQTTAYGQEQIFSIYINLFYPKQYNFIDDFFHWPIVPKSKKDNIFLFFVNKIRRITLIKLIVKVITKLCEVRYPRIVIIESFFSNKNLLDIILRSKGQIQPLSLKSDWNYSSDINWNKRETISSDNGDFDQFDKFFLCTVKYCFPKIFVEDFDNLYKFYNQYFERFKKIKYIINESWIGNNYSSIAVAILQQQGVKHIYNEHNYLSHHFLANNSKYLIPLVDKFVTLGWFNDKIINLVKGSSLYEWTHDKKYLKVHDILFINAPPAVKTPEVSAAYGHFGSFNASTNLRFNNIFFKSLATSTLNSILFRGYPIDGFVVSHVKPQMLIYDQDFYYKEIFLKFKRADYVSPSARVLMQKSRLIIVDYLSTSYLEAILANIPTIFFWNKESYPLEEAYEDFYSPLIEVGICQTDPMEAAKFIENIKENPEEWWQQTSVQNAKEKFLLTNFGKTSVLKEYLINLANIS